MKMDRWLIAAGIFCLAGIVSAREFFVSPKGVDTNPGSKEAPFATLSAARDAARKDPAGPHTIILGDGEYFISKAIEFGPQDNGLTLAAANQGKAVLYGGKIVGGWKQDGEKFWSAEIPEVKEGKWDFRAVVINGRLPERARMPETGTFIHKSVFDAKWLSSVGGGWERKPTKEELTTLIYDPKDIPDSFEPNNSELRVYHMWDESIVGLVAKNAEKNSFTFSVESKSPPGAFGVKKYVIFNTREGMTKPGQWYLNRTAGKIVYWPLPGEDMTKVEAIAPQVETVLNIARTKEAPVKNITLRGFAVQATTTPLKPAGFGAFAYKAAVQIQGGENFTVENLEVGNVGGQGLVLKAVSDSRVAGCTISQIGACGLIVEGRRTLVERNHVHHTGFYHPSAMAATVSHQGPKGEEREEGILFRRNEVHDSPYCGVHVTGSDQVLEENLIYRVMRELHDGAAIYGGGTRITMRGNMVRDVVPVGDGYGASAYYLDEGSKDCLYERNVAIDVVRPVHNHIASDFIIRDNVFIGKTNLVLSFPRSCRQQFIGNTIYTPGKVTIVSPNAVTVWTNNVIYSGASAKAFAITDAIPESTVPNRRSWPLNASRVSNPPVLDGEIGTEEWPGSFDGIDRDSSRWGASGAPAFCKLAWDETNLYVAVNTVLFDIGKLDKTPQWGKGDGSEIVLPLKSGVCILHGFADGTFTCEIEKSTSPTEVEKIRGAVKFCAKPYGQKKGDWKSGIRCEWQIPFALLGIEPKANVKIPINIGVYRAEDSVFRYVEGMLGKNADLSQAATVRLK